MRTIGMDIWTLATSSHRTGLGDGVGIANQAQLGEVVSAGCQSMAFDPGEVAFDSGLTFSGQAAKLASRIGER